MAVEQTWAQPRIFRVGNVSNKSRLIKAFPVLPKLAIDHLGQTRSYGCLALFYGCFFSVQKENHQFRGRLEKDTTVYVIHLKALTGPKGTGLMLIWKTHGSVALCPEKLLKDFSNPFPVTEFLLGVVPFLSWYPYSMLLKGNQRNAANFMSES